MEIRTCPLCMARVSAEEVVAYSDSMECPRCKTRLEVSGASRMLAAALGLLAAALVWRLTRSSAGILGWVLRVVYSFLAFSVVAPLFLMVTADLRVKTAEPPPEPVIQHASAAGHGHTSANH